MYSIQFHLLTNPKISDTGTVVKMSCVVTQRKSKWIKDPQSRGPT